MPIERILHMTGMVHVNKMPNSFASTRNDHLANRNDPSGLSRAFYRYALRKYCTVDCMRSA